MGITIHIPVGSILDPARDDDFGAWMAERDGLVQLRYRIYTAPMGEFADSSKYEFVADFANNKQASYYVTYMRGKKRYSDKDIIVREVTMRKKLINNDEDILLGKIVGVITVMGESLPVDEYEFKWR